LKAISRSPLIIQNILSIGEELRRDLKSARDVIHSSDPITTDDQLEGRKNELCQTIEEIGKSYKKVLQHRQKLLAVPRAMKPKQHRRLRWELARSIIRTSRLVRSIKFNTQVMRHFISLAKSAVDELKPLEREIARIQRKMEIPAAERHEGI